MSAKPVSPAELERRAHWKLVLRLLKDSQKALDNYHKLNMLRLEAHHSYLEKYHPEQQKHKVTVHPKGGKTISCIH